MSTRGRVIVSKNSEYRNFYRHCDCYPSALGEEIANCMQQLSKDTNRDVILSNIDTFADYISTPLDIYFEGDNTGFHGDEEYCYYIDLDKQTVTCKDVYKTPYKEIYSVALWSPWNPEVMDK